MDYKETLEYLYNSTPVFERVGASAYKEGLYNTIELDKHFCHPHRSFKTIHVAGTNGKGSTSHTLAAILQSAGYRVGLYTSPHLVDFSERIRVNGSPIAPQYVVDYVAKHKVFFEPLHPSFFEIVTSMAFKYFEEEHVDVAVIEVGLGGRLDCTNIITPLLSVITNISFDHTGFLGDTLPKIAAEKAGIIKQGVPVVVGEWNDETMPVFESKAAESGSPLIYAQKDGIVSDSRLNALLEAYQLKGKYQECNARTVIAAVDKLREMLSISDDNIKDGFEHVCDLTGLRGRWEIISTNPLVVCDTGHNVAGWEFLAPQIKSTFEKLRLQYSEQGGVGDDCTLRIVFGMVDDKDIDTVLTMLPKNAVYYFCQASTHRAIPVEKVCEKANAHGISGDAYNSVAAAYEAAYEAACGKVCEGTATCADAKKTTTDFIFVGGSSYVVADFLTNC